MIAQELQNVGIEKVKIRSVLTCEAKRGVCQLCYGRNMASGLPRRARRGGRHRRRPVDRRARHPADHADVPRRRHRHGRGEQSQLEAKNGRRSSGSTTSRPSTSKDKASSSSTGRPTSPSWTTATARSSTTRSPTGPRSCSGTATTVKARQVFAEWDPFNTFILTEETGRVDFHDVVRQGDDGGGPGRHHRPDEPGHHRAQGREAPAPDRDHRPPQEGQGRQVRQGDARSSSRNTTCPRGPTSRSRKATCVDAGDILAKIPRESRPDQGHHGRPAPGRGAVRGAPAQDPVRHLRDRRHRPVRRPGPRATGS